MTPSVMIPRDCPAVCGTGQSLDGISFVTEAVGPNKVTTGAADMLGALIIAYWRLHCLVQVLNTLPYAFALHVTYSQVP